MHLQSDESPTVSFVDIVEHKVLHRVSINPRFYAGPFRAYPHPIPAVIEKIVVTILYFLFGGEPAGIQRLSIYQPGCWCTRTVISLQLHLRTVDPAGTQVWAIDVPESSWGPEIVRLGLIRRIVTQKESMEAQDSARR